MRYFIHIVTDTERIIDPEGATFADLASAKEEASQSARDLMAEELRCARPLPLGWCAQIADENGAVVLTIRFASLAFEKNEHLAARPKDIAADLLLIERAKATFARVRRNHSEINEGLVRLKEQLRVLARFNSAFGSRTT